MRNAKSLTMRALALVFFSALTLFVMLPTKVFAGAPVQVTPVQFIIEKGRPIVTMTVKSTSSTDQLFQIDLKKWEVIDGSVQLSDNDNALIVTPPVFELKGGTAQTVRLGLVRPVDTSKSEQAWRIILRDITPTENNSGVSTMFVRMNISMPVFVPADNPEPLNLNASSRFVDETAIALQFENLGNRHAHIVQAQLVDAAGTSLAGRGLSHYVLPGQKSQTMVQIAPETDEQRAALKTATGIKLTVRNHVAKEVSEIIVPLAEK